MIRLNGFLSVAVKNLTLVLFLSTASCSFVQHYTSDPCNSRAYVRTVMADYLSTRYHSNAPVRMAVIPFSVPANLAGSNNENPGLGNELSWKVQQRFVDSGVFPMVEVLNRQDWPGKKEEFYTGNFGAIAAARDAGYDLVFIGNVDPMNSLDNMSATTKLIETESGITLWYGQTNARSDERAMNRTMTSLYMADRQPAALNSAEMRDDLARCIVREVIKDKIE